MPSARSIITALLCAFAMALAGVWLLPALAETQPPAASSQTMIIFDGSGSMWGRLDGERKTAKLDAAREALKQALAKAPISARYGLMSFGHRRSGDCNDIEVIAPVATGDPARINGPLEKLNPRGKGPITGALREAVKALGAGTSTPDSRSAIVLIHDNADNCRQDPCDAIAEIAVANPRLKVHLVSLALDREELARVACISKTTGGQLFDVKDVPGLTAAMGDVIALAMTDANGQPEVPGSTAGQTPAKTPQASAAPPSGPPGLRLSARLGAKSGPLAGPVKWRVLKSGATTTVFEGQGAEILAPLEEGSYIVEATAGFASARMSATVAEKGPTPVAVTLEAAALHVTAKDQRDSPASRTAMATLRRVPPAPGGPGPGATTPPLWIGPALEADFVLPAGNYRFTVSDNFAEREETFALAAGDTVSRDMVLGAGRLELTALARPDGEPLDNALFLLAKDDPDAPEGRREFARSAALRPSFVLPAGTYYVTVRAGTAEVRQRIGIGAGDTVKRAVSLGLARLTVTADFAAGKRDAVNQPMSRPPLATRIMSLDGEPRDIARSNAPAPEFTLAAGRYRVEATLGNLNAKTQQDIDVEAGSTRKLAMKLDANALTLRLAGPVPAGGVTWEIRDPQGGLIARTQQDMPQLILASGRYNARCEAAGRRLERIIDIAADGQARVVEFVLP